MFTVTKRMEVSGAHFLHLDYESKCTNLHGHNWIITVTVQNDTLDKNGMVVDFSKIKEIVNQFDHHLINDVLGDLNPTAENMAKWICDHIPYCIRVSVQETEGNVELYNKDTGKLICRHALCTRKGRTVYDDSHRKPRNAGVKIAERILVHVSGNREVAMWMDNLKRRKERYYRDNLEVILRIIPGYDKNTLIEAIRICLDKGIYNGNSVKSLCEYVCRGKENGTEIYGLEDRLPRQGGLIQSYNEILRDYDKT